MSTKASIAILLLLSAALLTGCTVSFGSGTKKTDQVNVDKIETACEQPDATSQTTSARLQEDLRLANERAKLAEEKAELEKQKREFAEERLKLPTKPDKDENGEGFSEDKGMSGS